MDIQAIAGSVKRIDAALYFEASEAVVVVCFVHGHLDVPSFGKAPLSSDSDATELLYLQSLPGR